MPAGMRYGVRTVSGGLQALCGDEIPGYGVIEAHEAALKDWPVLMGRI